MPSLTFQTHYAPLVVQKVWNLVHACWQVRVITLFSTGYYYLVMCQPRWLSGLTRSLVHSLMIARRSLCPEKLGSNPGQGSKGINFSGWHGLDMSITVTKRR